MPAIYGDAVNRVDGLVVESVAVDNWNYERFFDPPVRNEGLAMVEDDVERLVGDAQLDKHPFFDHAREKSDLILLWVSQELVTTNAFSQIVLSAASRIDNVHQRAVLAEVAYGEHGRMRNGLAKAAHPWLLEQMRLSLGVDRSSIAPVAPTIDFISRLNGSLVDPLSATAFIGVGNERLIEPEYRAVEVCFDLHFSQSNYQPFLHANIAEDERHSKLCYELADFQIRSNADRDRFLELATAAIRSRVRYFDELLDYGLGM